MRSLRIRGEISSCSCPLCRPPASASWPPRPRLSVPARVFPPPSPPLRRERRRVERDVARLPLGPKTERLVPLFPESGFQTRRVVERRLQHTPEVPPHDAVEPLDHRRVFRQRWFRVATSLRRENLARKRFARRREMTPIFGIRKADVILRFRKQLLRGARRERGPVDVLLVLHRAFGIQRRLPLPQIARVYVRVPAARVSARAQEREPAHARRAMRLLLRVDDLFQQIRRRVVAAVAELSNRRG